MTKLWMFLFGLLMFACGDVPADVEGELGSLEQPYAAALIAGSGNKQIIGTEHVMSTDGPRCGTLQLGGSGCAYVRSDPAFNGQAENSYTVKLDSSWNGNTYATDAANALNDVKSQMQSASSFNGFPRAKFYTSNSGDTPEIVVRRVTNMPNANSTYIPAMMRVTFNGMTAALTETASQPPTNYPGQWQVADQCTITIDSDSMSGVIDATEDADNSGATFPYWILKQAFGHGFLKCLGFGKGVHSVVTNDTPYSHQYFTKNVYLGTRYFSPDEKCLYHYSCPKNNACGGVSNMFFQPISGASACNF